MQGRRFVFWSWSYAFATTLVLAMVLTWIGVAGASMSWLLAAVLALPTAACVYLARRTRVVVVLQGDTLTVRPGLGPKRTIMLRAADRMVGEGPYRETEAGAVNRSEAAVVDHKAVDGPVIAEDTPLTRGIGSVLRMLQLVLFRNGSLVTQPSMEEAMAKFSVVTERGTPYQFIVPAQGSNNEASVAALRAALNGTDEADTIGES